MNLKSIYSVFHTLEIPPGRKGTSWNSAAAPQRNGRVTRVTHYLESRVNVTLDLVCRHQFLQYLCALGNVLKGESTGVNAVRLRTQREATCSPSPEPRRPTGQALWLTPSSQHTGKQATHLSRSLLAEDWPSKALRQQTPCTSPAHLSP